MYNDIMGIAYLIFGFGFLFCIGYVSCAIVWNICTKTSNLIDKIFN